jgi:hypothetical protein
MNASSAVCVVSSRLRPARVKLLIEKDESISSSRSTGPLSASCATPTHGPLGAAGASVPRGPAGSASGRLNAGGGAEPSEVPGPDGPDPPPPGGLDTWGGPQALFRTAVSITAAARARVSSRSGLCSRLQQYMSASVAMA